MVNKIISKGKMGDPKEFQSMKVGIEEEKKSKTKREKCNLLIDKKDLNKAIKKQIEYYFSDSNLYHDIYLLNLLNQSGKKFEVASNIVIEFARLKQLLANLSNSQEKLKVDKEVILSEDMKVFKRKQVFNREEYAKSTQLEDRTIYIENFPETITCELLATVLTPIGEVLHINMSRYDTSKKPKGYAFVEYGNVKEAETAIEVLNGTYPKEFAYPNEGNSSNKIKY